MWLKCPYIITFNHFLEQETTVPTRHRLVAFRVGTTDIICVLLKLCIFRNDIINVACCNVCCKVCCNVVC